MSEDTVDDLHAAEDFAGSLVACLEELLALTRDVAIDAVFVTAAQTAGLDMDHYRAARARGNQLVENWTTYCRPTCGAEGDPDSAECVDEFCGCPCGHADDA